jgi:hypothetical protein
MHLFSWIKNVLDDDLVRHITTETNRYAHQYFNTHELAPHSREHNYKDVTPDEMWTYLGNVFMTGIGKPPEIKEYWSTRLRCGSLQNFLFQCLPHEEKLLKRYEMMFCA